MKNLKALIVLMTSLALSGANTLMAQNGAIDNTNEVQTTYAPISSENEEMDPPPPNVLSVKESVKADLKLYPNPSAGNLNIETNLRGSQKLLIIDLAGNVHIQKDIFIETNGLVKVDLCTAARGLYLVKLGNTTLKFQKV